MRRALSRNGVLSKGSTTIVTLRGRRHRTSSSRCRKLQSEGGLARSGRASIRCVPHASRGWTTSRALGWRSGFGDETCFRFGGVKFFVDGIGIRPPGPGRDRPDKVDGGGVDGGVTTCQRGGPQAIDARGHGKACWDRAGPAAWKRRAVPCRASFATASTTARRPTMRRSGGRRRWADPGHHGAAAEARYAGSRWRRQRRSPSTARSPAWRRRSRRSMRGGARQSATTIRCRASPTLIDLKARRGRRRAARRSSVTLDQALRMRTLWRARGNGEDDARKGSIEVGDRAETSRRRRPTRRGRSAAEGARDHDAVPRLSAGTVVDEVR